MHNLRMIVEGGVDAMHNLRMIGRGVAAAGRRRQAVSRACGRFLARPP